MRNKVLVLIFMLMSVFATNSTKVNASMPIDKPSLESQNKSYENSLLVNSISKQIVDNNKNFDESDSKHFSGIYLNKDQDIVIGISSKSFVEQDIVKSKFEHLISFVAGAKGRYQYESKRYSLKTLLEIKTFLELVYDQGIRSILVSQKNNRVEIEVDDIEKAHFIHEYLATYMEGFETDMVTIKVGSAMVLMGRKAYPGQAVKYRTNWLFFWTTHITGSIGFNAVRNGVKGIVTCQHVAELNHQMYDKDNNYIGTTSVAEFNGVVDAAFVPFANQTEWDTTNIIYKNSNPMYLSYIGTVVEGSVIMSYGITTNYTYGNILSAYYSNVMTLNDGSTLLFTHIISHTCLIQQGDSGGPLIQYYPNSNAYGLLGINFGGTGSIAAAIKIENIMNTIGVQPIFN